MMRTRLYGLAFALAVIAAVAAGVSGHN